MDNLVFCFGERVACQMQVCSVSHLLMTDTLVSIIVITDTIWLSHMVFME